MSEFKPCDRCLRQVPVEEMLTYLDFDVCPRCEDKFVSEEAPDDCECERPSGEIDEDGYCNKCRPCECGECEVVGGSCPAQAAKNESSDTDSISSDTCCDECGDDAKEDDLTWTEFPTGTQMLCDICVSAINAE